MVVNVSVLFIFRKSENFIHLMTIVDSEGKEEKLTIPRMLGVCLGYHSFNGSLI